MKFWIPHADGEEQTERVYEAIKQWARSQAFPPAEDRIESVSYAHEGKRYVATVGQRDGLVSEEVIAILRPLHEQHPWMICTPNRGVARGGPVLVQATDVVWFDPPEPS